MDQTKKEKNISFNEISGKNLISDDSNQIIGKLDDIYIEPNLLEIGAIITSVDRWLLRPVESIPSKEIFIKFDDIVRVRGFDLVNTQPAILKNWLSVSRLIKAQKVTTTGGANLGRLKDIMIDNKGRIVSYILNWIPQEKDSLFYQVSLKEEPVSVIATHSIDSLVMILNDEILIR